MNKKTTCCFSGHRADKLPWKYQENDPRCIALKLRLADALRVIYDSGYRHFLCGMANGCDLYFGEAVIALRDEHPDVTLEAAIPFDGQQERWPTAQQERYFRLAEECDIQTILHRVYTPDCMMDRNHYMVDCSGLLLAAYDGMPGGTMKTILYAMRSAVEVIQLPVDTL